MDRLTLGHKLLLSMLTQDQAKLLFQQQLLLTMSTLELAGLSHKTTTVQSRLMKSKLRVNLDSSLHFQHAKD